MVLALVAWWFWVPAPSNTAHRTAAAEGVSRGAAESAPSYSSVDERLLDAQDAGDAAALRGALAEGANPNLLAPNGSSMLMLAAHRGQLEHIDALLNAGAQPDLRQTQKDSERGDTALLRAFYGGHLAAARRLVQAGASLAARNRWDWGAVHMAAQSGCVPCLQWLAEQGQPVKQGRDLVEVTTEKIALYVTVPADGVLAEIRVPANGPARVGQVIGLVRGE